MEKTLKRLTWLVSVTAFLVFGSVATYYAIESNFAQERVLYWTKMKSDSDNECITDNTNDITQCLSREPVYYELFTSAVRLGIEASNLTGTFLVLTLTVPLTVWYLFFSFRWVLTGRKPWQRESLPPA